jgi:hypothetical protein
MHAMQMKNDRVACRSVYEDAPAIFKKVNVQALYSGEDIDEDVSSDRASFIS